METCWVSQQLILSHVTDMERGGRGSDAVNRVPDAPHLFANPARCLDDGLHYRALTCAPNYLICDLLTFFKLLQDKFTAFLGLVVLN